MEELTGKTVLVTGASSGIGWSTARAFAARGCRIAIAARRADKLRELAEMLRARGAEALELPCDIREERHAREAVEATVRKFGRIDVLINNAGILQTIPFERQKTSDIEDILRTNLLGAIYALHAALPHMRRQGQGHVVNVASIAGLMGIPHMAVYCASKFALVGLTESLRREFYGTGITLTALCPGLVDTPMIRNFPDGNPSRKQPIAAKTPEQVAEKIVRAVRRRAPEVVYGETPGALVHLARLSPHLTDWAMHRIMRRLRPHLV